MILIEGCARSGTSIVGELLAGHPRCRRYAFEEWWPFGGIPLDEVPDTVAKMPRYFDPTPGLGCDVHDLPAGPTIWVRRPARDVVASLRPLLADRWGCWPVPYPRSEATWVERAATLWWWHNRVGLLNLTNARPDVHLVDYVDVVTDPLGTAQRILDHVGWPWCDEADSWVARITDTPGVNEAARQVFWRTEHATHIDRWTTDLTDDEADLARRTLRRLGDRP